MPKAFLERIFGQLVDGIRNVLPQAWQVREPEVEQLGSVLFRELQDGLWISHWEAPL
jgi:hypothetical protein